MRSSKTNHGSAAVDESCAACEECANCSALHRHEASRRAFVREMAGAVAGVVAFLGLPDRAEALAVHFTGSSRTGGTDAIYPLPAADGVTIDKVREVILVRWQGAVYAFSLSCPHQKTALKWKENDGRFQCPKHKSRYEPNGTFISGRATRGMDRYAISLRNGDVIVNTAKVYHEDEDKAGWDAAVVKV